MPKNRPARRSTGNINSAPVEGGDVLWRRYRKSNRRNSQTDVPSGNSHQPHKTWDSSSHLWTSESVEKSTGQHMPGKTQRNSLKIKTGYTRYPAIVSDTPSNLRLYFNNSIFEPCYHRLASDTVTGGIL